MDEETKDKWVAALRSGKYKQCQNDLRADGGFCCLGVLADIKGVDWHYRADFEREDESFLLNEFAGIGDPYQKALAHKNDGGWSFDQIANYIEDTWQHFEEESGEPL